MKEAVAEKYIIIPNAVDGGVVSAAGGDWYVVTSDVEMHAVRTYLVPGKMARTGGALMTGKAATGVAAAIDAIVGSAGVIPLGKYDRTWSSIGKIIGWFHNETGYTMDPQQVYRAIKDRMRLMVYRRNSIPFLAGISEDGDALFMLSPILLE